MPLFSFDFGYPRKGVSLSSFYIDKKYIDGPWELFIRRSMDKLLGKYFSNQQLLGPNRTETFVLGNPQAQPFYIRTAPLCPNYKSELRD